MSFRYGVRLVRHGPGSAEDLLDKSLNSSAHSETVSIGSGLHPRRNAAPKTWSAFGLVMHHCQSGGQKGVIGEGADDHEMIVNA